MKTIHLHGKIGKIFGEQWKLDVESVTEALRAIDANTGNFFDYLLDNLQENKTFSFLLDTEEHKIQSKEELLTPLPQKCKEFHIIPNAEGAATVFSAFVVPLLVSLATGFIMRALFKPPKIEEKETKSFLFSGGENVAQQGVAVPLGYGRLLVGSVVVSASMTHIDRSRVDSAEGFTSTGSPSAGAQILKTSRYAKAIESSVSETSFARKQPVGAFSLSTSQGGGTGG